MEQLTVKEFNQQKGTYETTRIVMTNKNPERDVSNVQYITPMFSIPQCIEIANATQILTNNGLFY
jgi:hypothetical protein